MESEGKAQTRQILRSSTHSRALRREVEQGQQRVATLEEALERERVRRREGEGEIGEGEGGEEGEGEIGECWEGGREGGRERGR